MSWKKIFAYLDTNNLIVCENVCRKWKDVIVCGPTWRKLLQHKVKYSKFWRKSWDSKNSIPSLKRVDELREFCLSVTEKLKEVERNKRTGSFRISTRKYVASEVQDRVFYMNEDYILFQPKYTLANFQLFNRYTAEFTTIDLDPEKKRDWKVKWGKIPRLTPGDVGKN